MESCFPCSAPEERVCNLVALDGPCGPEELGLEKASNMALKGEMVYSNLLQGV